jgi:putative colanic acid biosynthesis UDP-glucose lipid carrier transferase
VLYRQQRVTWNGEVFEMLKFRTMPVSAEDASGPVWSRRGESRATPFGTFLRRTSLDELPQLLNVVKGDMSLVGPRPEQVELVDRYRPEHVFRLALRPGLSGPMQVYGRGQLTFDERLAVEREYIENLSLGRDLRILALTLAAVVGGRGAY